MPIKSNKKVRNALEKGFDARNISTSAKKVVTRTALTSKELVDSETIADTSAPQTPSKSSKQSGRPVTPNASKKENKSYTPSTHREENITKQSAAVALDLSFEAKEEIPIKSARSIPKSKIAISPKVKKIYQMVAKRTGSIGGNGSTGAIYGELTSGSMQKIINIMIEKCELSHRSRFIDVGAGLGKPNLHVIQDPGVRVSLGIELEDIRWQLSMFNLSYILDQIIKGKSDVNGNVNFIAGDIDDATTMDPFTHIYMYDLGFPPPLQKSIAKKFNESVHAKYLVSYRPPHRVIDEYLYKVEFIDQILTSMHGSGEGHTAYFYKRTKTPKEPSEEDQRLVIKSRDGFDEKAETVVCDKMFYDAVALAVGEINELFEHVNKISSKHMEAARPIRTRKPSKLD